MDKIYTFIPKKTFFMLVALMVVILILGMIIILGTRPGQETPTPIPPVISQSPNSISPSQKSTIGKTTKQEFSTLYPDLREQVLSNGNSRYEFPSTMKYRSNEVIFGNNVAQFERVVLLTDQRDPDYLKLSDQILKYGPAERIIKGSKTYGDKIETHIYANKGFAFVVNPFADEVYEVQVFSPTSVENYLNSYGEDISYTEGKEVLE